jgi:hypothetical protein
MLFHNRRSAASQQARGGLQETPSCGRHRVERGRPQSWPHRTVEARITNRVVNIVFALALLGTCAVGQDKGQARTAATVGDVPVNNGPSPTSLSQGFESGDRSPVAIGQSSSHYWKTTPVGDSAQLLTLFCRTCCVFKDAEEDVPLVSVLRDTLGDKSIENDRVTYVWLLTYTHPRMGQRILSAVPFFYWRITKGSNSVTKHDTKPFMDLSAPENRMMLQVSRNLLQWTAFDPMTTPVRASTHAYGTNRQEDDRLHIEEAISYLRQAPVSDDSTRLTQVQLDTVIGKLKLREILLGGLATDNQAARVGMQADFEQERIRSRNRELLRQWAEKTGLIFEPLTLNGNQAHFAVLWFPQSESAGPENLSLKSIWKLLAIRNPWTDERLKNWKGPVYERTFDNDSSVSVIPLAVYSLDYPKQPLILMDFRHKLSRRRREVVQRSVTELISGVFGISHFADWYFYIAFDLHRFIVGRRGAALDEASRLDCYSDFRVSLALDRTIDPSLKKDMETRIRWLAVNPLETATQREIQNAFARYKLLEKEADDGDLMARVDQEHRLELSSFGESEKTKLAKGMLHVATLGFYKQQAKSDDIFMLDHERRVAYQLSFLDSLIQARTPPEISYDSERIKSSVRELSSLMPSIAAPAVRSHAEATVEHLKNLSKDDDLRTDCTTALALMKQTDAFLGIRATGLAARSSSPADAFSSGGTE